MPGAPPSAAQVVLDGTLGPAGPLAGPNYDIGAELGRQVGGNLFHSFGQFDVGTGESATFSGPASVSNVIGRVTGGSASNIDGAIRSTIPSADLFLINPAGMVFGPNATLDVQGSFHASTANEIRFPDGGVFSASNPGASVLTTAPPSAFGFLDSNPAALLVDRSDLAVPAGATLAFVGGDVRIAGEGGEIADVDTAGAEIADIRSRFDAPSGAVRVVGGRLARRRAGRWRPFLG